MDTMLSRSGVTNPDGKMEHRLDVPVSEALFDAVNALAVIDGKKRSEWVRFQLEKIAFGELSMLRSKSQRPSNPQVDKCRMESGE